MKKLLLFIFLLMHAFSALGQKLNNPNKLPYCDFFSDNKNKPTVCFTPRIRPWGYEGEMKDGKRHGIGIYYFQSGTTQEGIWDNDAFVRAERWW